LLRKHVTTSMRRATAVSSWLRSSLLTAATISGVRRRTSAAAPPALAASDTTQSRNYPSVQWPTSASATASWVSIINCVTLVLLVGHQRFVQEIAHRHDSPRVLGSHALLVGGGGPAGQHVARPQRRGPRQ